VRDEGRLRNSQATTWSSRRLGEYELLLELGKGSNGVVYLARRPGLDRLFAVKVLAGAVDSETAARFGREARLASRMEHPGLVPCVDVGVDPKRRATYLVMEYVPGQTLEQRLAGEGRLEPRAGAQLAAELAGAVAHAHAAGIVHRDLKPANVLIDARSGRVRVTDFGLAFDLAASRVLSRTGDVVGTPAYMAPEQVRGERGDARTDVYALGVILYELVTGDRPFVADTAVELGRRIVAGGPARPRELRRDVPPELEAVCLRALALDPSDRYPDAGALAAAIRAATPAEADPRAARPSAPRALAVLPWALVGLLLLVAGALAWGRPGPAAGSAEAAAPAPAEPAEPAEAEALRAEAAATSEALVAARADLARVRGRVATLQEALARAEAERDAVAAELRHAGLAAAGAGGRYADGLERWARLLEGVEGARAARAELLLAAGRDEEALRALAPLVERPGADPRALVLLHRATAFGERSPVAARAMAALAEAAPPDGEAAAYAREAAAVFGRRDPRRLLARPWPDDPDRLWLRFVVAGGVEGVGPEVPVALSGRYFERVGIDPRTRLIRSRALYFRWRRSGRAEDLEAALAAIERARPFLDLPTTNALNAGICHLLAGRPRLARIELEQARAERGSDQELLRVQVWLGNVEAYLGDEAAALEHWLGALRRGQTHELAEFLPLVSADARRRVAAASRGPLGAPQFEVRPPAWRR